MRQMIFFVVVFVLVCIQGQLHGQTTADARLSSVQAYDESIAEANYLSKYKVENIGPTVFSGRVTDMAVDPNDPTHFYVSYASGGLWETTNNGTTFTPLFDQEMVMTIGAIAVDWSSETIWVGTGEVNSSRSSYAGVGMYVSADGGKNWQHKGLPESHHIGRIVIHPNDPKTVWVAVLGHLYTPHAERGVYMTTDGGDNWTKSLFVGEWAGAVDLMLDPADANTLYAATWHRERYPWNFVESGAGSGIHKSTDGGQTWDLISGDDSGFPTGDGVGRIGLSAGMADGKVRLYAFLDNYNRRPKEEKDSPQLTKNDFREMSTTAFAELDDVLLEDYLRSNGF
ncbi:MAG: glycosyl hydrolase, partial [Bacteroidota bacterium]